MSRIAAAKIAWAGRARPFGLLVAALMAAWVLLVAAPASADSFSNPTEIKIPASGTSGPASPYPSSVSVSGMSGPITDVNVTLHRVGHTNPGDIQILLVSPSGDTVNLMRGNCGGTDIEDNLWTFNQQASTPMPWSINGGSCPEFAYRPNPNGFTALPAPAPAGPHGVSLNDFNNENPNGTWRLYVADEFADDVGDIEVGWTLTVTTGPADVKIPATGTSGPASPYPATRTISGHTGLISDLNVSIDGIWHQHPDDLDLLLVGPEGQKVILMSDACGAFDVAAYGWSWNDDVAAAMPDGTSDDLCNARFYLPTDYVSGDGADIWPAPAPAGPYSTSLPAFNGTDPNGEWRLFVNDDGASDTGFFTNRFQLEIMTVPRPDTTAPKVSTATPTGTGIGRGTNVAATFSEAMDAATINGTTFKLSKAGSTNTVGAALTYNAASQKAVLDLNNRLVAGTKYKAVVTTGAKDLAGNALDQNPTTAGNQQKTWTFITKR